MNHPYVHRCATEHCFRWNVRGDSYVTFYWPKNATQRDLKHIREAVLFQIDTFLMHARRETEAQEAARLEYESWFAKETPDAR